MDGDDADDLGDAVGDLVGAAAGAGEDAGQVVDDVAGEVAGAVADGVAAGADAVAQGAELAHTIERDATPPPPPVVDPMKQAKADALVIEANAKADRERIEAETDANITTAAAIASLTTDGTDYTEDELPDSQRNHGHWFTRPLGKKK